MQHPAEHTLRHTLDRHPQNHRHKHRRHARLAAPLTVALLSLVPLGSAPAQAAATGTRVALTVDSKGTIHGGTINLRADVLDATGTEVRRGRIKLQARPVGGSWTTLRTVGAGSAPSGAWDFTNVRPKRNTDYRVRYTGVQGTYAKSRSAKSRVTVDRRVRIKQVASTTWRIRFTPEYGRRPVDVTWRKKGTKKFKHFRTLTTNGKGWVRFRVPLTKANGRYKVTSRADARYGSNLAVIYWR